MLLPELPDLSGLSMPASRSEFAIEGGHGNAALECMP